MTNPKMTGPADDIPSDDGTRERLDGGGLEVSAPIRGMLEAWPERATELAEQLALFVGFLLRQNEQFNLTGDRTAELQWNAHVGDALPVARLMEESRDGVESGTRILDVGSGGGIPGIVWALLWPKAEVTLLEATGKKVRFLREAGELLGLANLRLLNQRAEDAGREAAHRETYDIVTARALANLPVLAEWTMPFLRVGGQLFAIKGPDVREEISLAHGAFETLGGDPSPKVLPYQRGDGRECHLLVYQKARPTPREYPRKAGMAKRRPL